MPFCTTTDLAMILSSLKLTVCIELVLNLGIVLELQVIFANRDRAGSLAAATTTLGLTLRYCFNHS